jgi:hypothetical protein
MVSAAPPPEDTGRAQLPERDHVENRFISIEGYLKRVLNFDAHSLKRMRDQTLE